jgi:hypothetical protein
VSSRKVRLAATTSLLLIAFIATYVVYGRLLEGTTVQRFESPDRNAVAEYREYAQSSATSTNLSTIELRTSFNPFRHTVLSGLDYGGRLSISWIDFHNLLVRCTNCADLELKCNHCGDRFYVIRKETKWRDITIHYEGGRG